MPCTCHYTPSNHRKKTIKTLCEMLVAEIKQAESVGDPIGISIKDTKELLDHLYNPTTCKENPIYREFGGTARCITSDGRNVNIAEELNRLEKEKLK